MVYLQSVHATPRLLLSVILVCLLHLSLAAAPNGDSANWHIQEIYNYLGTVGEDLPPAEIARYCRFIVDSQDPKTGNFRDRYGETIYSVKAHSMLKRFGYEEKYPLGVCSGINEDWGQIDGKPVTEHLSVADFRKWLEKIYVIEDAYAAGSSIGHFITPHVMNLKKAGKVIGDSPYIPVLQQWLLDNQGENGFWNRPDDPDFNGWNGVMKMDQALKMADLKLPRQERMIQTVLQYQDPTDGSFTAAGGCTNHNALHTLRQWSKRNDLLMWREVFRAMDLFTACSERRWDPTTGLFRTPPGFDGPLNEFATKIAESEVGNVISYCQTLLAPENAARIAAEPSDGITRDRIRALLVRAMGLAELSKIKAKELAKAKHDAMNGAKEGS